MYGFFVLCIPKFAWDIDLESHVTTPEVTNDLLAIERTECLLSPQIRDVSVNHATPPIVLEELVVYLLLSLYPVKLYDILFLLGLKEVLAHL